MTFVSDNLCTCMGLQFVCVCNCIPVFQVIPIVCPNSCTLPAVLWPALKPSGAQHVHWCLFAPACIAVVCCVLQGMELYSTVLWHLKRDIELAHLAQHVLSVDRLAPEAW